LTGYWLLATGYWLFPGEGAPREGPGLGIEIDEEVVERYAV
jgi:L-alanine-DL-glutamate epimerase-like enolase superfamily enzyme